MQNFLQMIWAMQRNGTSLPALFDGQIKAFQAALLRYRSRTAGSDYLGGTTNVEEKKHVI